MIMVYYLSMYIRLVFESSSESGKEIDSHKRANTSTFVYYVNYLCIN